MYVSGSPFGSEAVKPTVVDSGAWPVEGVAEALSGIVVVLTETDVLGPVHVCVVPVESMTSMVGVSSAGPSVKIPVSWAVDHVPSDWAKSVKHP